MGIRINKQVSIQSIESRFELTFKRERVDIAKLLKYLKQGHSIDSAFNYSKSIASSIRKMLVDERLIDTQDVVTPAGEEFINYPFKVETERGIYNLYLATVQFGLEKVTFVIRMERKLSNDERTQESANLGEIYVANEFSLGQNEVGVMEKVDNKSKSFCSGRLDAYLVRVYAHIGRQNLTHRRDIAADFGCLERDGDVHVAGLPAPFGKHSGHLPQENSAVNPFPAVGVVREVLAYVAEREGAQQGIAERVDCDVTV